MGLSMRWMALLVAFGTIASSRAATSEWVHPGPDGKLVYKTTPAGDRIMDFSFAGYMGGGVALPDVPVVKTVKPTGGEDDTETIQKAIDEVGAMPIKDGFRGAVVLSAGTFTCAQPITIAASGVVLRGSGADGATATTIKMVGRPHVALAVRGGGPAQRRGGAASAPASPAELAESSIKSTLADAYVPSGTTSFNVTNASAFTVGDTIAIRKPATEAWIKFMQMDDLTRDGRDQTWIRAGSTIDSERHITKIDGNKVTVDVPLSDSYDAKYLNPPGTSVVKIRPPARLAQVGIENLHIECPPQEISHTQAHFSAIRLNGQDCWVRDVAIDETMNSVGVGGARITLQRVSVTRKAKHLGASKPAEFAPNGQQVLLDRCSVTADNVWFVATGAGVSGPIVVLNCTFHGLGRSESHQRWSTGMLYDNVRVPDGGIELRNRGEMGSGHGWSMGWGVLWNCRAKSYIVQNPPGAMNWLIGSIGEPELSPRPFGSGPMLQQGTIDSAGVPVAPQSLYLTQLTERLGPQAVKNIGYESANIDNAHVDLDETVSEHRVQVDKVLGPDLAMHRPVSTSNVRGGKQVEFGGEQALDGDDKTAWRTDDNTTQATLELDTEGALEINALDLAEATDAQDRVQEYKVEGQVDSDWKLLSQGTTIGDRKIDHFPKVIVWKVRLTIVESKPGPAIRRLGLYLDKSSPP